MKGFGFNDRLQVNKMAMLFHRIAEHRKQ